MDQAIAQMISAEQGAGMAAGPQAGIPQGARTGAQYGSRFAHGGAKIGALSAISEYERQRRREELMKQYQLVR